MKRPALKEYQARAIVYAENNPYSIIAMDPGLGKSRVAIDVREKLGGNCLVVCPSYLILNWVKEIKKWTDNASVTTFKSGKQIYYPSDSDYVVTSYDIIQKSEELLEWADMVILDEAHAIKSMKAKRSAFLHKNIFENSVKRLHLLTGTPIKNRVQEFYSLLAICHYSPDVADPEFLKIFPDEITFADYFSYRESYDIVINGRYVTILKWSGLQRVDELKTYLSGKYFRVKSSEVLDLPPVSYKSFLVSDEPDEELRREFFNYFEDDEFLRENSGGEEIDREDRTGSVLPEHKAKAALKKVPFTIKYAKDLLEEVDCVLIYSDHVESTEAIAKEFGVKAITGKVPANTRSQMADAFQSGEGRVLACTIGSMKEGKDLYRSSHIIFNDLPWVPGDMKQVIYRIQRIGQKSKCTVHKIFGSPQDEYIGGVLDEKIKVIEGAT